MEFAPDIAVYSHDGSLQMVGEVQRLHGSAAYAAEFRQSLLEHGLVPRTPYFAIIYPERIFLWDAEARGAETAPPTYSAGLADVWREYLGSLAAEPDQLPEWILHMALSSWFRDLADATRKPLSEADRVIVDSGLYEAIRRGRVASGPG